MGTKWLALILLVSFANAASAQSNDETKAAAEVCKQNRPKHINGKDIWPEGYDKCAGVMEKYFQIWGAEKAQKDQADRDLINKVGK